MSSNFTKVLDKKNFCQAFTCYFYPPYVTTEVLLDDVFFLFPVTDISATVVPIGVKLCMMVHIGAGQVGGGPPRDPQIRNVGPNFGYLTANISRKISCSVTCQL